MDPLNHITWKLTQHFDSNRHEVYAIGDIHQCHEEFESAILWCREDAKRRGKMSYIVQLGDLIDRGPDLIKTLRLSELFVDFQLMGNHEWYFLQEQLGHRECKENSRVVTHALFETFRDKCKNSIKAYMRSLIPFMELVDESTGKVLLFSHSPIRNFNKNGWLGANEEIHLRSLGDFMFNSESTRFELLKHIQQDIIHVHGHQSWKFLDMSEQKQLQLGNRAKVYNIDSGCVYGNHLSIMRVMDEFVFTIPSSYKYEKPKT
jgi:hypothetical protein